MNIYKAGLIPIRSNNGKNHRILIVYRKKYNDFTFPKGKQEQDEHIVLTAHRESFEETGINSKIGPYVGSTSWQTDSNSNFSEAKYWLSTNEPFKKEDEGKRFDIGGEITYYSWHSIEEGEKILTYEKDKKLLKNISYLSQLNLQPILIILRHAEAEPKLDYKENDLERELTKIGKNNAKQISKLFSLYPISKNWKLVSSPARRCFDSLVDFKDTYMKGAEIITDDSYSQNILNEKEAFGKIDQILNGNTPHIICTHRPCIKNIVLHISKKYHQSLDGDYDNSLTEHHPYMVKNISTSSYIIIYKSTSTSGNLFFSETILL